MEEDKEIRRNKLRALAEKYKSQREFADALDQTPGYIHQLLNGHRAIGEKSARKIEEKLKLPKYFLDNKEERDYEIEVTHNVFEGLTDLQRKMILKMQYLTKKQQEELLDKAESISEDNQKIMEELSKQKRA